MSTALRCTGTAILALLLSASTAFGQAFSQPRLDQMLAPIALYPDPLLAQMMMASTYPPEVAEAARWSRANSGLSGDLAVRAVDGQDWDPSVKSLVAFPQVLAMMDERADWVQDLGEAFLAQDAQVMATVQALRQRASAAGNLPQSEQLHVGQQGPNIVVQPVDPRVFYVPYYDPLVVYGPWWWPAYRPVRWRPWPGYFARPGLSAGFHFGPAVRVSPGFFSGRPDWQQRRVTAAYDPALRRGAPEREGAFPGRFVQSPSRVDPPAQRIELRRAPAAAAAAAVPAQPRRVEANVRTAERHELRRAEARQAPQPRVLRSEARPEGRAQPEVRPQTARQTQAPGVPATSRHEHRKRAAGV